MARGVAMWLVPPPPVMQMLGCGAWRSDVAGETATGDANARVWLCIGLFAGGVLYAIGNAAAAATICDVILTIRVVLKYIPA